MTFLLVGLAVSLQYFFWSYIHPAPFLFFYPAIILAALFGEGISAILLSALLGQYFFVVPHGTWSMQWPNDPLRISVFVLAGFMINQIIKRERNVMASLEDALKELEKEKTLRERFVSTLTHDLNTPLTSLKLNIQSLQRRVSEPEFVQKRSEMSLNNVDRLVTMVRDLLDANKIRAGKALPIDLEFCDLSTLVINTIKELEGIHGPRFTQEIDPSLSGNWSSDSLKRILENLVNNAVKYGDEQAPIRIGLRRVPEQVIMSVNNQGKTIPKEKLEKLFDAFMQVEDSDIKVKPGWGLGLTLVKGLAEALHGSVDVVSTPETGTTFSVTLPYPSFQEAILSE